MKNQSTVNTFEDIRLGKRYKPEMLCDGFETAILHFDGKTEKLSICDISSVGIGVYAKGNQPVTKGAHFTVDIDGLEGIVCLCVHSDNNRIGGSFVNPFDQIQVDGLIVNMQL